VKLRDFQETAVNNTLEAFESYQSALLVICTGGGKTVIAAHIADRFKNFGRILLVAHREELIFQGQKHLENITGGESEIEMADSRASLTNIFGGADIVVSTIQTQISGSNGGRMTRFDPFEFSLLIVDESHHATSPSFRKVIDYYKRNPKIKILGLTATPDRNDEEALGQVFETVPFEYDISDGIADGWLVPISVNAISVDGLDFSAVRTTAGELNSKDLAAVLEFEENLHEMTTPILDLCGDDTTLIFTVSVAQAERMSEILNRHKPGSAEYICGTTPKDVRREILAKYDAGDIQYLCNVGIATEGFDCPRIQHIVMGRPTKSRSLCSQIIGRGTRALPGVVDGIDDASGRRQAIAESAKPKMTVLDFVGNSGRHKLIHPADVLGGKYSDEIVELATRNAERRDGPVDITSELVQAEREWERRKRKEKEAQARKNLRGKSTYKFAKVDPFDVFHIVPCREPSYHKGRQPTMKQLECLEKRNIPIPEGLTFAHASQLIDTMIKRGRADLCTFKQAKLVEKFGYDASELGFKAASALIDAIAKNGWRRPKP